MTAAELALGGHHADDHPDHRRGPAITFTLAQPRTMRIGGGAVADIGEVVAALGVARPLLVTDTYLVGTGAADRLLGYLRGAGLEPGLFAGTVPDSTTRSLDDGLAAAHAHGADAVIGFGGGSPMDTAKALALLAVRGGHMREHRAPARVTGPALPVVAVPTTAGSGSEAT